MLTIFQLASTTNDTLGEVLNMLDEMSLALPRFRSYEESLPMTPALERALTDVYAEITCFCARAVRFLRSAPHRECSLEFVCKIRLTFPPRRLPREGRVVTSRWRLQKDRHTPPHSISDGGPRSQHHSAES